KGRNNIRIGFSVEAIRDNIVEPLAPAGTWTFSTLQQFLTVQPFSYTSSTADTNPYRGLRSKIFGAYIQDDFRFRPNLTLNLGVRYEPSTVVSEVNNLVAYLHNLAEPNVTIGNPVYRNPTLRNFAPRVGLAWDPSGNGKTAVRAGFG